MKYLLFKYCQWSQDFWLQQFRFIGRSYSGIHFRSDTKKQKFSEDTHHGKSTQKNSLSLFSNIPSRIIQGNADISQIFFILSLIIKFISSNFHQPFSWKISLLFLRRVTETLSYRTRSKLSNIFKICQWCMFCFISNIMESCLAK